MLAVPVVLSLLMLIVGHYLDVDEKLLFSCIVVCWVTYFCNCMWDVVGIQMGWWSPQPVN